MKTKTAFTLLVLLGIFLISSIELRAQIIVNEPLPDIGSLPELELLEHTIHLDDIYISAGRKPGERNSRLLLSKKYDGETVSRKGGFNIEKSTTRLKLSINGSVKSGTIKVALVLPGGKAFKTITIDDAADIYWSESINIKEGEGKYHGEWKYEISTVAAKGRYNLSINSF